MKNFKNTLVIILSMCLVFCMVGCAEGDTYDNFNPVGVRVVESINGSQFETVVKDETIAKKMWEKFEGIVVDTEIRGEMGSAYLYMCFYDETQTTLGIFTIYENGSCCLGEDFKTFYTVEDGQKIYVELCDMYTDYVPEKETESK